MSLRRRLSEMTRKGPEPVPFVPAPQRNARESWDELPFCVVPTACGAIHQRLQRIAPSRHVGTMPVDAALGARAEVLALLALDPSLAGLELGGALYLDTETTGLGNGAGSLAFLVGMAFCEGETLVLEQLLLAEPSGEAALIERVRERITACSLVITYNGKAFDLPLLRARAFMNRLPELPERPHLDLLHVARRLHRARLGACKLGLLESRVLGFEREGDVHGADIAPRYAQYLRTGDEEPLLAVVEHNVLDVLSMAALVGLYGEPLGLLAAGDLVPLARTYKRAGALDLADQALELAREQAEKAEVLRVSAEIAQARGDRARALRDFEQLAREVNDERVRLELAKLYEHHAKDPAKALAQALEGTREPELAQQRRVERLRRKLTRGEGSGPARGRRS